MARTDRTGKRKPRSAREPRRIPSLGYYIVVTDAIGTEPLYFNGLHDSLPENLQDKLVIKVIETKTKDMVQKSLELTAYEAQYRIPWIVFDRDKVTNFDEIIREAQKHGINVGWSNPCFEIWMFAYYGNMPSISQSWTCCQKFSEIYQRKTGFVYSKTDSSFYRKLCNTGDEKKAIKIASQRHMQNIQNGYKKPSEMVPCSTVYELVREIRSKLE